MRKTLAEIAKFVGGEVVGNSKCVITGLSGIKEANEGDLTFLANSKYFPLIKETKASAVITPRDSEVPGKSIIRTDNPSLAFTKVASLFFEGDVFLPQGIHKTAIIAPDATLGKNVSVGPHVVIESKVKIGNDSVICAGTYIGSGTVIGTSALIYPNVTIRERIVVGDHVIIHSGSVIGSDGFGFISVDGAHQKIPQIGTVVIEDDVEIGANVAIDRARFDKTIIGKGTKIDNLVHIAHNVIIGEHCLIVAQVGVSGSCVIGKNSILAGQAGLAGHLMIGEGAIISAQAGVTKSVPAHTQVSGYPAQVHKEAKRINAHIQRLPHYVKLIQELQEKINQLENKTSKLKK